MLIYFYRNDFDVETISGVAAGLQPSTDDIPDVKKVVYTFNNKIYCIPIYINSFLVLLCSVPIVIETHLLSVRCVVVHHIALHFVKAKTGTIIKWSVTIHKEALCLSYKHRNDPLYILLFKIYIKLNFSLFFFLWLCNIG